MCGRSVHAERVNLVQPLDLQHAALIRREHAPSAANTICGPDCVVGAACHCVCRFPAATRVPPRRLPVTLFVAELADHLQFGMWIRPTCANPVERTGDCYGVHATNTRTHYVNVYVPLPRM